MYLPMLCHFPFSLAPLHLLTSITTGFSFVFTLSSQIWLWIRIVPSTPSYTLKSSTGIAFPLFIEIWKWDMHPALLRFSSVDLQKNHDSFFVFQVHKSETGGITKSFLFIYQNVSFFIYQDETID